MTDLSSSNPADPSAANNATDSAANSAVTRAVILARGLGTRMRKADDAAQLDEKQAAVAASGVKALIDVGRPFLDYVISVLADVGVTEICLVIGPEHDVLREYAAASSGGRVTVTTAVQTEPLGTGDAVAAARDFAGDERVIVLNSDNYYPREALAALAAAPGSALVGFDRDALVTGSNIPSDRIRSFALVATDEAGQLQDIVEKPDEATLAAYGDQAPVSMNAWLFTPAIFDACARIEPSVRGELEVIDAVRLLVAEGEAFTVVPAAVGVLDMSSRGDVAAVQDALSGIEVRL
ncbi:UTP--glucose-1-phosphate uridylyltransferase [Corynebacterium xerosis]|uniref:nucleotidyltransferase family protein n=1 Tax=Brachybacterium tyrofermentans TaxID=47848 RepID=UPI000A1B0165|nr:UTP--glucose-1-phosphate uridylyltransferase [Corynebacterium xerosis]